MTISSQTIASLTLEQMMQTVRKTRKVFEFYESSFLKFNVNTLPYKSRLAMAQEFLDMGMYAAIRFICKNSNPQQAFEIIKTIHEKGKSKNNMIIAAVLSDPAKYFTSAALLTGEHIKYFALKHGELNKTFVEWIVKGQQEESSSKPIGNIIINSPSRVVTTIKGWKPEPYPEDKFQYNALLQPYWADHTSSFIKRMEEYEVISTVDLQGLSKVVVKRKNKLHKPFSERTFRILTNIYNHGY